MLYHLFEILESQFNLPGASLFSYLSFRAAVTVIMALSISIVFGKKIINIIPNLFLGFFFILITSFIPLLKNFYEVFFKLLFIKG